MSRTFRVLRRTTVHLTSTTLPLVVLVHREDCMLANLDTFSCSRSQLSGTLSLIPLAHATVDRTLGVAGSEFRLRWLASPKAVAVQAIPEPLLQPELSAPRLQSATIIT